MKKRTTLALAALLSSVSAHAADLPHSAVPPAAGVPVPVFTWSGFYAGVNAGYAWGRNTFSNKSTDEDLQDTLSILDVERVKLKSSGFTGGAQLGYNYQLSSGFVLGLEGDAEYVGLRRKRKWNKVFSPQSQDPDLSIVNSDSYDIKSSTDFLSTLRGRLGYAFDRILVYGTGGLAIGNVRTRHTLTSTSTTTFEGLTHSGGDSLEGHAKGIKTGYAFGGGIEYALPLGSSSNAVTLGVEYLRYDLGSQTLAGDAGLKTKVRNTGDLVRAGLNYKFNGL